MASGLFCDERVSSSASDSSRLLLKQPDMSEHVTTIFVSMSAFACLRLAVISINVAHHSPRHQYITYQMLR